MADEFIRLYIGEISLHTLQSIQRETGKFSEWRLTLGREFDHKNSYGYKRIAKYEALVEAIAKCSDVVTENRSPNTTKPSLIWNNALNIADVLTLISLARAKYYPTMLVEKRVGKRYSLSFGTMISDTGPNRDIVPLSNLGQFISNALTHFEQNPYWLTESGFKPSIYWYEQAQRAFKTAPTIMEMSLYWVSVEISARIYLKNKRPNTREGKKGMVKTFLSDKGYSGAMWTFLGTVIDDWYNTRCNAFHEGIEPQLPDGRLKIRRQQVRDFTSLVLVEMIPGQQSSQREQIAKRIASYEQD